MNIRRTLSAALGIAVVVPILPLGGPAAQAGVNDPTCFGSPTLGDPRTLIVGTNQSETLVGTPGEDIIIGRRGKDNIKGLGGGDLICGSEDSDPPDAGDIIHAGPGSDIVAGGRGHDDIFGGNDRDNLFGNQGADLLNGGANSLRVGDEANYFFAANPIVANLARGTATGEGNDRRVNVEGLGGSDNNDRLIGDNGLNSFDGLAGDDVMKGRRGVDTLGLTFANSKAWVNLRGGTSISVTDGSDTISSMENVIGSPFDDYVTGTGRANVLFGAGGHDTLYGRAGDDILIGFQGHDTMFGGAGVADFASYSDEPGLPVDINLLLGEANRSDGNDALEGIEMVEGSDMDDTITGDNGPNFFFAEEGDDTINGKGGSDLIFFLDAQNGVVVNLVLGTATGMAQTTDSIDEVENIVGSDFADDITGDGGRNFLNGSTGIDSVRGLGNNDYLAGGAGNDNINGGGGTNDLVDFFQSSRGVSASLAGGEATGEGTDVLQDVESLSGTARRDRLAGSALPNRLYGQKGGDTLVGYRGNDRLDGGRAADTLRGGEDNDRCFTKKEASGCETFSRPSEHPLAEVGRRYKKAVAAARRYKRRYK